MIPLRHCFRFSVYLSLESLTLCSAEAAAEETYSPCTSGQFHYLICQTKTGTPHGQTWTNGRWWKQTDKFPLHFSFYVHFGACCFLYSLSADLASKRGGLCFCMKKGPLCNAPSLYFPFFLALYFFLFLCHFLIKHLYSKLKNTFCNV